MVGWLMGAHEGGVQRPEIAPHHYHCVTTTMQKRTEFSSSALPLPLPPCKHKKTTTQSLCRGSLTITVTTTCHHFKNTPEFVSPQYLYKFVRVPIARPGFCYR